MYVCVFKGLGEVLESSTAEIQIRIRSQAGFGVETLCERRATALLLVLNSDHGFALVAVWH